MTENEAINKALKMFERAKLTYEQAVKIIEILEDTENDRK